MKGLFSLVGVSPYLLAIFLNAFTDLGHKIIIQNTIFKIYDDQMQVMLTAVVNALVLLPFIFLFTPSGFLADRFAKHLVLRYGAIAAIVLTLLITFSYYMGWFWSAFFFTFLMGAQSAIYSPAKYGYIKELVGEALISSGNAAVQSVTTVAILVGIIFYTVLFENSLVGIDLKSESEILKQVAPLGWLLVGGSIVEYLLTLRLPNRQLLAVKKRFDLKHYRSGYYLRKNFHMMTRKRSILVAIIALSLFWSISQVVLASFGAYAKADLGIENAIVVQGLMALAAIGIIIGSMMAAWFSKHYIHLGLIPLGALGFTLMVLLLPFTQNLTLIAVEFISFGLFAGFFIVPLNAYIQKTAPRVHLGTILAANNLVQNIFMVLFLGLITLFSYYGISTISLFYLMFGVGAVMSGYLLRTYLSWFIWLVIAMLLKLRYKIIYEGLENVPKEGGVLMLGNHISWMDWVLVQLPIERRIRYVMERSIYNWKGAHQIWKLGNAIAISERASKGAFQEAREALHNEEMLGIYPEGTISRDGEIGKFYRGFEMITKGENGKIVPYYIGGIYGSSLFSRSKTWHVPETSLWRRVIRVAYAKPLAMTAKAEDVRETIVNLKERTSQ
jgi:acyl-[acyl-carrier-protein]-phospholipid O-acyltransferase/long-chain-fatty-acid--[acyl-carrier-protein] ligase